MSGRAHHCHQPRHARPGATTTRGRSMGPKRFLLASMLALLATLPCAALAQHDCRAPAAVCDARTGDAMPLVETGVPVRVLVDDGDFPAVHRAAEALREDLAAVSGGTPDPASRTAIIAGTCRSARSPYRAPRTGIDTTGVAGTEAYLPQVVERLSRASTAHWWSAPTGVAPHSVTSPRHHVSLTRWADAATAPPAAVRRAGTLHRRAEQRYRGIFINDESPPAADLRHLRRTNHGLDAFQRSASQGQLPWPAMWQPRALCGRSANGELADEYGVVIATSQQL